MVRKNKFGKSESVSFLVLARHNPQQYISNEAACFSNVSSEVTAAGYVGLYDWEMWIRCAGLHVVQVKKKEGFW